MVCSLKRPHQDVSDENGELEEKSDDFTCKAGQKTTDEEESASEEPLLRDRSSEEALQRHLAYIRVRENSKATQTEAVSQMHTPPQQMQVEFHVHVHGLQTSVQRSARRLRRMR